MLVKQEMRIDFEQYDAINMLFTSYNALIVFLDVILLLNAV